MDVQRAEEISNSPQMMNVRYNGNQVYIEHVDKQNGVATIHSLNEPNKKESVSITKLVEY